MLPNDKFGRSVTMATADGEDNYTVTGSDGSSFSVSFPAGTDVGQVYNSINGQAPAGYTPPAIPLNQQYTRAQFGALLIQGFSDSNGDRGLTADQNFQIAQMMAPFALLAQAGDLDTLVAEVSKIPVDGVLITQSLIDMFVGEIQAYLNGN